MFRQLVSRDVDCSANVTAGEFFRRSNVDDDDLLSVSNEFAELLWLHEVEGLLFLAPRRVENLDRNVAELEHVAIVDASERRSRFRFGEQHIFGKAAAASRRPADTWSAWKRVSTT